MSQNTNKTHREQLFEIFKSAKSELYIELYDANGNVEESDLENAKYMLIEGDGYAGFYTKFSFDDEGNLLNVGAYE